MAFVMQDMDVEDDAALALWVDKLSEMAERQQGLGSWCLGRSRRSDTEPGVCCVGSSYASTGSDALQSRRNDPQGAPRDREWRAEALVQRWEYGALAALLSEVKC
jgi:hypothetical protein